MAVTYPAALLLCAACCVFCCSAQNPASVTPIGPQSFRGFISVSNERFVDEDCQEFPVVGFNGWQLMEAAAGLGSFNDTDGLNAVEYTFAQAANDGQTVVRVFGHGINETLELQPAPGVYNETAFVGLDYVLATAAQYGVRVLMTMADYWLGVDSYDSYVRWANLTNNPDGFFSDDGARTLFRNHMETMANRVNTLTGLAYKDDPVIFAWDLMNEVRCDCFPRTMETAFEDPSCNPTCADNVTAWITEMADYLKTLDSNHLVTVGQEGYWGSYDPMNRYNPGNGWASITGQNFTAQHKPASIDFAAIHFWPDLWTPDDTRPFDFLGNWLSQHEAAARQLGKPLILEEFGKNVSIGAGQNALQASVRETRMPIFRFIYDALRQSMANGDPLRGVMFWQWGMQPQNSDSNNIEVAAHDVDYEEVVKPAAVAALTSALEASPVGNCQRGGRPSLEAAG